MNKYFQIFKISLNQEFAYRANFIMWRVRNVFQVFLLFFLWDNIFLEEGRVVFGYNRSQILTYVFSVLAIRALVLSSRTIDVAGEIQKGDISNYLVKPINYFKYWFTRDLSSKFLNVAFATLEFTLLLLLLKPPIFFQSNLVILVAFLVALVIAILIYFLILLLVSAIPFWAPELSWGAHFLFTYVIVESLSGALFPLNILSQSIQSLILATPFPYLIYFPIQVYLGNITGANLVGGLLISSAWAGILYVLVKIVWARGLKVYEGVGR